MSRDTFLTHPWSGQAAVKLASIELASCLPLRGSVQSESSVISDISGMGTATPAAHANWDFRCDPLWPRSLGPSAFRNTLSRLLEIESPVVRGTLGTQ